MHCRKFSFDKLSVAQSFILSQYINVLIREYKNVFTKKQKQLCFMDLCVSFFDFFFRALLVFEDGFVEQLMFTSAF